MSIEKNEGSEPMSESVANGWEYSDGISLDGRFPMTDRLFLEFNSRDIYDNPFDNYPYLTIRNIDDPINGKQIIAPRERYTSIRVGSSQDMLKYLGVGNSVHPELVIAQYVDKNGKEKMNLHQAMIPTFLDRKTVGNIAKQTFGNNPSSEELVRLLTVLPQFVVNVSLNQETIDIFCRRPINDGSRRTDDLALLIDKKGNPNFWIAEEKVLLDEEWAGESPNQYRLFEKSDKAIFEISSNETDLAWLSPNQSNIFVKDDKVEKCNLPALSFGVELSSMSPETLCKGIQDEIEKGNVTDEGIRQHINPFLRLL